MKATQLIKLFGAAIWGEAERMNRHICNERQVIIETLLTAANRDPEKLRKCESRRAFTKWVTKKNIPGHIKVVLHSAVSTMDNADEHLADVQLTLERTKR